MKKVFKRWIVAAAAVLLATTPQFPSAHAAVAVALFTAVFAAAPQFSSCASDKAVETVYLGTPAHVWWENDTTGKWSSVAKTHEYQVKLYIADNVDRDEEN